VAAVERFDNGTLTAAATLADASPPTPPPRARYPGPGPLSRPAKAYYALVVVAAAACALPLLSQLRLDTPHWDRFLLLAVLTSAAQLFTVEKPGNQTYKSSIVFLLPAAILLPAPLVVLLVFVQYLPEWVRSRKKLTVMGFNIMRGVLDTLATWGAFRLASDHLPLGRTDDLRFAVAGLIACLTYVVFNHVLLARMISLAHGRTLRDTSLFSFDYFSTDLFLACLGVGVAAFWLRGPWLIPLIVAPLILIHRALAVPQLRAEARIDPKTGLFNARHFAVVIDDELGRAARYDRPLSLIMADLDLLRDVNNTYGHLAGDAVLRGIAEIFRQQLRQYDLPARFGGEEFCILLPETPPERAIEIAERIRHAVAETGFAVDTSADPVRATISLGVAAFPRDGATTDELVNTADLAVYRAKLQGRNRVVDAAAEPITQAAARPPRLVALPGEREESAVPAPPVRRGAPAVERRLQPPPHRGQHALVLPGHVGRLVAMVAGVGLAAGVAGVVFGTATDVKGLAAVAVLVAVGEAIALEVEEMGTLSVSAVGAIAGVALFGVRAALPLALTIVAVSWIARRERLRHVLFNAGALTLASLAAVASFAAIGGNPRHPWFAVTGILAGAVYFVVNTGLVAAAMSVEGKESSWLVWRERFSWVTGHYLVYGLIGAVMATAYRSTGLIAFVIFAIPLVLMRKAQDAYLRHTQHSVRSLRLAAETIQKQNVSLDQANRLLKERSTAAMESLTATVDARDAYTAGHSRRVQQFALAIGTELGLSKAELELLGHAALFHDIGKLAVPDAVLQKAGALTPEEWTLVQRHVEAGAEIISRLGFLNDAVPTIRHHHERFDGEGYPDGLEGEEIPLGARIIHVADAYDSMLSTRVYRPARPQCEALAELERMAGTHFCPRCVAALEASLSAGGATEYAAVAAT